MGVLSAGCDESAAIDEAVKATAVAKLIQVRLRLPMEMNLSLLFREPLRTILFIRGESESSDGPSQPFSYRITAGIASPKAPKGDCGLAK